MRGRLVRDIVKKIDKRAPAVAKEYTDRLRSRIAELIGDAAQIPEERILMEAAVFCGQGKYNGGNSKTGQSYGAA